MPLNPKPQVRNLKSQTRGPTPCIGGTLRIPAALAATDGDELYVGLLLAMSDNVSVIDAVITVAKATREDTEKVSDLVRGALHPGHSSEGRNHNFRRKLNEIRTIEAGFRF